MSLYTEIIYNIMKNFVCYDFGVLCARPPLTGVPSVGCASWRINPIYFQNALTVSHQ